jgi:hypothetical protein
MLKGIGLPKSFQALRERAANELSGWSRRQNNKHTPAIFLSDIVEYRIAKYHGLAIVSSEKRKISKIIMHCPACGTKTLSNNQEHNAIASVLGFMNKETSYEDAACVSGVS